jgi:hypothetical protein
MHDGPAERDASRRVRQATRATGAHSFGVASIA